jgi:hypothetical protein
MLEAPTPSEICRSEELTTHVFRLKARLSNRQISITWLFGIEYCSLFELPPHERVRFSVDSRAGRIIGR